MEIILLPVGADLGSLLRCWDEIAVVGFAGFLGHFRIISGYDYLSS